MKYAYKTLLSTIALGSAVIFAQAPAATEATAQAATTTAQATPAVQAAAPATAEQAAAPAQAAPATEASSATTAPATNAPAAPAAETAPATTAEAAPETTAKPDSVAAAPAAAEQATAATAEQTAATVTADTAQKAPDSTVAAVAPADSATGGFVADTTTPPPTLLEGTEIAGDIHGFLKLDKSPYLATDMLIVFPNMSLVVEPGVIIYFKPGTGLQVNKGQNNYTRVTLDTEGYRARREETLRRLARKNAAQVARTGRSMAMEPMNPYERHVLHAALQGFKGVTTHSEGEEPNRRVIITPDK
jgi:chemotaxis protein histidine kinase CheA